MKPTALVTGATGFLGGHLVRALRDAGFPVVAWMRGASAQADDPGLRREPWPSIEMLPPAIERLQRPIVYHLAAAADRRESDPAALFESNIRLTAELVAACARAGVSGFVHAGSSNEYGPAPVGVPIRENAALAATDLYGASKAAAGLWAQAVARDAGLGFAWARPFALYGPGLRPPRLLPVVHAALRQNRPIDLAPGAQMQDWVYVGDAAGGLLRLGEFARQGGQGVFNLCTGRPQTNRELATAMAQRMGADPALLRFGALPARANEPPWLVGDPAAARELGWTAMTDLATGLDATIAAFDRQARGAA
ncbi:MAG TPA: NAD(P)-dependent oxidoreductase [Xanthobacteraceae bacterium]